jgi:hypothetical protein
MVSWNPKPVATPTTSLVAQCQVTVSQPEVDADTEAFQREHTGAACGQLRVIAGNSRKSG